MQTALPGKEERDSVPPTGDRRSARWGHARPTAMGGNRCGRWLVAVGIGLVLKVAAWSCAALITVLNVWLTWETVTGWF